MNKARVIIIHGWEGSPQRNWFPWLAKELEKSGCEVLAPLMPDADHPRLQEWQECLKKTVGETDERTYFVGHSLGVIAILRYLETLEEGKTVGGVISVAGFSELIGYDELNSFFKIPLEYGKVKRSAKRFVAIASDNDPHVPKKCGEILRDRLGAELIIIKNGGHLNTEAGCFELPVVLEKINEFILMRE
jgi:predicted alpha/beta hydrolase family esterase